MRYLLDTGILLRLVNRVDPLHDRVRDSVRTVKLRGDVTVTSFQNRSEFWNVCTRPPTSRGGLGLSPQETLKPLRLIERLAPLLADPTDFYERWKALIVKHSVSGVQVHDAKLVTLMIAHGVTHILTLNQRDFARYSFISAVTPEQVMA